MENNSLNLKSPFPYFGGKSTVSRVVWQAFGDVRNYVEPFFGSGAVLLNRPNGFTGVETVNDLDGFIANFWRAIKYDPEKTAYYADWPVNENDLQARHGWLVGKRESITDSLNDPDFFDAKIAGWWVWGICQWIGGGWCSGKGCWQLKDGKLIKIDRQLQHLSDAEQCINRKIPHLGNAGRGINRVSSMDRYDYILDMFSDLSARLRDVRVCCGDWSRALGDSVTIKHGVTGVFLDPPYSSEANRQNNLYAIDSLDIAQDVLRWCIEHGENQLMRIALCGYEGEHSLPPSWYKYEWKTSGGYANQSDKQGQENTHKERIWFSPSCQKINNHKQYQYNIFTG